MIRILIRLPKVLAWSATSIVFALLLTFLYYDVTEFQPRRDDIARLIAKAQPAERHPPEVLRNLLLTEHRGDPSHSASQLLLWDHRVEGRALLIEARDALIARAAG